MYSDSDDSEIDDTQLKFLQAIESDKFNSLKSLPTAVLMQRTMQVEKQRKLILDSIRNFEGSESVLSSRSINSSRIKSLNYMVYDTGYNYGYFHEICSITYPQYTKYLFGHSQQKLPENLRCKSDSNLFFTSEECLYILETGKIILVFPEYGISCVELAWRTLLADVCGHGCNDDSSNMLSKPTICEYLTFTHLRKLGYICSRWCFNVGLFGDIISQGSKLSTLEIRPENTSTYSINLPDKVRKRLFKLDYTESDFRGANCLPPSYTVYKPNARFSKRIPGNIFGWVWVREIEKNDSREGISNDSGKLFLENLEDDFVLKDQVKTMLSGDNAEGKTGYQELEAMANFVKVFSLNQKLKTDPLLNRSDILRWPKFQLVLSSNLANLNFFTIKPN